ncbi:DUF4391 family protein [Tessaracoccus sp. OH4464_COT-324]|nr:DUF4391 family protein [Tessaracoccus sp. OH4464_COT-324]
MTINLEGSPEVPEIQVFVIEAKGDDVSDAVLTVIDKAVKFPIIFEIVRQRAGSTEVRMVAAHKRLGRGTPKLSGYYSTTWRAAEEARQPLPVAITLPPLYAALLAPLASLPARPGESMAELADRLAAVRQLEREVTALERRLFREQQFNRKVELRRTLKARQHELEQWR